MKRWIGRARLRRAADLPSLLRSHHRLHTHPGQIFFHLKQIVRTPLNDFQETIHRRHFLQLFGQEPLEKIDRDVVILRPRQFNERVDLMRDLHFLVERKLDRGFSRLEAGLGRIDPRKHHSPPGVYDVFNKAHRVLLLLFRLREKVLGQLRERIRREVRRDRDVLQGGAEFIANLFVNGIDYFIADEHRDLSVKGLFPYATIGLRSNGASVECVRLPGTSKSPRLRPSRLCRGFPARSIVCSSRHAAKSKKPDEVNSPGFLFWRRPTLAQPIVALPSGLQRFTSVFGMGDSVQLAGQVCAEAMWNWILFKFGQRIFD